VKDLDNISTESFVSDPVGSTSLSLVRRLKLKRPDAWQRMAQLYAPLVFHWCRCAKLQPADADDVVQEVFRTVDEKIATFQHGAAQQTFRGWMRAITRNKLGDVIRRRKASAQPVGGTDGQLQALAVPDPEVLHDEATHDEEEFDELYRRAVDFIREEFQPKSWNAFWKVVIDGRSAADVAHELGISTNAVYVAKSRILNRLREELGDV
jgi:RNA polymerase sigma-70 factor (ECF subfamily)